jgi:hypothetical protein
MLSSCDLILPHDTNKGYGKIVLVDVSLNYTGFYYKNYYNQHVSLELDGPINDAADVVGSFSALAAKSNTPLYIIPMNQYGEFSKDTGKDILHDKLHQVSDPLCPTKANVVAMLKKLANDGALADFSYENNVMQESIDGFVNFFFDSSSTYLLKSDLGTVTDDDLVIFYYSGHGLEDLGDLALCQEFETVDEPYNVYAEEPNFLPPSSLLTLMSAIPGKKFIILDSCYSGVAVDEDTYTTNTQNDEYDGSSIWDKLFSSATATQYDDVYVMTATNSTHRAGDDTDISPAHGCLTRSMDEAIGWDWKTFTGLADDIPANDGGDITVDSLYASTSAKFDSCYAEYYGLDNYLVVNGGREDLLLFTGL